MADWTLPLAAEFDPPDEARWRALAEKALAGKPWERLISRTADGIAIAPLFRAPDAPTAFVEARGEGLRNPYLPWDIRAVVRTRDPVSANREILEDLEGGASSVELLIGGAGGLGVAIDGPDALARTLSGVMPDLAPIALNASRLGTRASTWLVDWLAANADPAVARPAFNLDPATPWLRDGGLPAPFEEMLADAAGFAAAQRSRLPKATFLAADGRAAHEAGGSEAQELALMLASGVTHLRALEANGVEPAEGAGLILFRLAAGPDVMLEIAKLRAVRVLWARVLELCGVPADARSMRLHAVTSRRMLTRYDAWTNILRGSAACFAAACGGADAISVLPMTALLGEASPQARRLARNTQIVLQEEAGLGRVADPAGGAWAVERLTADLAEAAWAVFERIEARGGLAACLRQGDLQEAIGATARARAEAIATRRSPVTGLSDFPLLAETTPAYAPFPPVQGAGAAELADPIAPAPWITLAAPFEALRDVAAPFAPRAFFANLSTLASFSARANFALNLFAAGGVAADGPETAYETLEALVAAFAASKLAVAVICGGDDVYADQAEAVARALKAAGAQWVVLAGKPGGHEAAWRAAGIDQFVFAGQDALEALRTLHAAFGLA